MWGLNLWMRGRGELRLVRIKNLKVGIREEFSATADQPMAEEYHCRDVALQRLNLC